jgi:small-conductance mechanosensitive channel
MISESKISVIVQIEPFLVVVGLLFISFLIYRMFFKGLSDERHALFKRLFTNAFVHLALFAILFAFSLTIDSLDEVPHVFARLYPYVGFLAIVWGAIVLVKISRIVAFEYLFLISKKAGVPVLLVNIFSLAISIALASLIATEVFSIRLAPVLATSALISVILGLAIQDTLGNLFAGVALQFDKPYQIGHWIEVQNENGKWVGQVQEITWRSTVLMGILDEMITIPNRLISQSEVQAWGADRPFVRTANYRVPFDQSVEIENARATIVQSVGKIQAVRKMPAPRVYLSEVGDAWLNFRLVYWIDDYGAQFRINDEVNTAVVGALFQKKIPLATPAARLEMV